MDNCTNNGSACRPHEQTSANVESDLRLARYERACWWLEQEINIVPLKPRSKELQPGYGTCSALITCADLARKWFLNTDANLGVVLGGPMALAVADWDSVPDYESWHSGIGAVVETLAERTARGYHLFFAGIALASGAGAGCELKTRGVCAVSPSVHPSGVIYRVVRNTPIASIDNECARSLFPFLSKKKHDCEHPRAAHSTQVTALGSGNGVIARIKLARPIVNEMKAVGIKLRHGGKATLVGLCPFHHDHSPSLWVNPESGLWGCNAPGCPAAGTHDVINFRAQHRGISNDAAIKQLAGEFLSSPGSFERQRT